MVISGAPYTRKKAAARKDYYQFSNGTFHPKEHRKKDLNKNTDKFHTESRIR